eukprot:m51a1_g460 putative arp2 3 complex-activating protein (458) ;mRNA; r:165872-168162
MKTAQDERKIVAMTQNIILGVKKNSKLLTEVARVAEQYSRTQIMLAQTGYQLADLVCRVASSQGQVDLEKGILSVAGVVREVERSREDWAKTIMSSVVAPIRTSLDSEKRDLPLFAKKVKQEQKRARDNVKKAEEVTKKAGKANPAMLQTHIQNLNEKVMEAQQVILDQLRAALLLERNKYCSFIRSWTEVFKTQEATANTSNVQLSACMPALTDLAESKERIPSDMESLVSQRKRTLLDIGDLSSEWKKIFQSAGVSKADLQDEETARMILAIIEDAAIKQGVVPPSSLSALNSALNDEYGGRGGNMCAPADRPQLSSSDSGSSMCDRTSSTGSGSSSGSGTLRMSNRPVPPPPPRSPSTEGGAPPLPRRSGAPPPPPPPERGPAPGGLLSQIQNRSANLKSSEEREPAQLPDVKNFKNTSDLTSILRSAMEGRRPAMKKDEGEEEWSEDEDAWSD